MITIKNYDSEKNNIDWKAVPKNISDNRADVESIMEFYDDDTEIKETVDLFFKGINDTSRKKIDDFKKENPLEIHDFKPSKESSKSSKPKTLAAFKQWLKENIGYKLYLVGKYDERIDNVTRIVEKPQSNSVGFKTEKGTTSWIQFGSSKEWEFTDKYARWTEERGYTILTYYYDEPDGFQVTKQEPLKTKHNSLELNPKPKKETLQDAFLDSPMVRKFMPKLQQMAVLENDESEEVQFFIDLVKELEGRFKTASKRQDNKRIVDGMVYAHYFYGDTDFYITEVDAENNEFFGFTILNGDHQNSEGGYISWNELNSIKRLELDFYFKPQILGIILHRDYPNNYDKYEPLKTEISKATAKKPAKKAVPTVKVKKVVDTKNLVDNNSTEFLLIKRFYAILKKGDNAIIPFNTIRLLYAAFNKAAVERKVRASSEHAALFTKCNEKVTLLFEEFANPTKSDVKIEFSDKKLFAEIEEFSTNKKVNPSVALLKRFITIQGTLPSLKTAETLLKAISNRIENSNDRLKPELLMAKKEIETYVYNPKEKVEVTHYGLSRPRVVCKNRIKCEGVDKSGKLHKGYKFEKKTGNIIRVKRNVSKKKIVKGKLSVPMVVETIYHDNPIIPIIVNQPIEKIEIPIETNEIVEQYEREPNSKNPPFLEKKVVNNELMNSDFETLEMDEGWDELMQQPAKNMKIAIWGKPKNGKTAGALKLANYLTKFGNVYYNFADQGFNANTKALWIESGLSEKANATPSKVFTLAELHKDIQTGKFDFVFIDMISDYIRMGLRPEEFKTQFIKKYPDVSFILVFEVTKTGNFKGDQGWTHVVDATMTVENFLMENRGRYGMGQYLIWEEGLKKFNPKKWQELQEEQFENLEITQEI